MPPPNLAALRSVADRLDRLGVEYAFVGGSVVNLLLDHPELSPARPTDDFDVIVEAITERGYADIEDRLRKVGFSHDMRPGAPSCRWLLGNVTVDIMPTAENFHGLNTQWFSEALLSAEEKSFGHTSLRLVSPVAFLSMKYVAFLDRGNGDYYGSRDIEDFVTVIDGRKDIAAEITTAPTSLGAFVQQAVRELTASASFNESLPGHLPSDEASQRRLRSLRQKLAAIAA